MILAEGAGPDRCVRTGSVADAPCGAMGAGGAATA
jgi:hypothetical protein